MSAHNDLGHWGEDVVAEYLVRRGYRVIERNWKIHHKEIDIIASDGKLLLFVEVKTRSNENVIAAYEAVDEKKRHNLLAAMHVYLRWHYVQIPSRFDIITVVGNKSSYRIVQYENAVSNFIGV